MKKFNTAKIGRVFKKRVSSFSTAGDRYDGDGFCSLPNTVGRGGRGGGAPTGGGGRDYDSQEVSQCRRLSELFKSERNDINGIVRSIEAGDGDGVFSLPNTVGRGRDGGHVFSPSNLGIGVGVRGRGRGAPTGGGGRRYDSQEVSQCRRLSELFKSDRNDINGIVRSIEAGDSDGVFSLPNTVGRGRDGGDVFSPSNLGIGVGVRGRGRGAPSGGGGRRYDSQEISQCRRLSELFKSERNDINGIVRSIEAGDGNRVCSLPNTVGRGRDGGHVFSSSNLGIGVGGRGRGRGQGAPTGGGGRGYGGRGYDFQEVSQGLSEYLLEYFKSGREDINGIVRSIVAKEKFRHEQHQRISNFVEEDQKISESLKKDDHYKKFIEDDAGRVSLLRMYNYKSHLEKMKEDRRNKFIEVEAKQMKLWRKENNLVIDSDSEDDICRRTILHKIFDLTWEPKDKQGRATRQFIPSLVWREMDEDCNVGASSAQVRQKAAVNREKFRNTPGGMYRPGSHSSIGSYGDRYEEDRYASREEDRNGYGYGREREMGSRDDDRYNRDGDRYGRDYEERYGRDGYRDDDRGRSRSVDYNYDDTRSRNSDRDRDFDDDGQHSSRFCNTPGGRYRPGSHSSIGSYGDRYEEDRYASREEDRNGYGYGREREMGSRDDDRYNCDGDRYGRDYEERYGRDGYRDDDRGRSRSVDYNYDDTRSRNSDRDRDFHDDGQHSSRGSNAKVEDQSLEARLQRKLSEQNSGAPPSYEEAVGEAQSPVPVRDVETSAESAPRGSSPHASDNPSLTSAPTGSSPVSNNPTEVTAAASTSVAASTAVSTQETEPTDDFFDPRGPTSAAPTTSNFGEIDLLGSLSDSFSSNALPLVPATSGISTPEANTGSTASFAAPSSGSNNFNQSFEDPFGDSPFKADTSVETAPSQPHAPQTTEPSQSDGFNADMSNFGFGDSFSIVPYSASAPSDTQPFSANSQFLSQDSETDILADILPPAPLPEMTLQQNSSAPTFGQPSPSFSTSSGPFSEPTGQLTPHQGFSAATNQPAQTLPSGQFSQGFSASNSSFSASTSPYAQQPFPSHSGQPGMPGFSSSTGHSMQPPFASQGGQSTAQTSSHTYGGLYSLDTYLTPQTSDLLLQSPELSKREVNKRVLKVPGIEQKVLDVTSNEPWDPHETLLAVIAQATRNPHEYQMIMSVVWKRINYTGKNWRHVYTALTILEYLVAHGSERVIDEIKEHSYQISTLSDFQYIDPSGRDHGNNVRKKSQNLIVLVNDKERIVEVRQKAAVNREKFRNNTPGGMYRPGSHSSIGSCGDRYEEDRYASREEDRNGYGYGREREMGSRDDDRYNRDGDRYGRDYEERYGRDGYRDDDRGRSRSVDYNYDDTRSRNSDRDRDFDDDGQHSSRKREVNKKVLKVPGIEQKVAQPPISLSPPSSTIQHIMEIGGGSWDRDTVIRALLAANNNPERAVGYLHSLSICTDMVRIICLKYPGIPNLGGNENTGVYAPLQIGHQVNFKSGVSIS